MLFDIGEDFFFCKFSVNLVPLWYLIEHLNQVFIGPLTDEKIYILSIVAKANFIRCDCFSLEHFKLKTINTSQIFKN